MSAKTLYRHSPNMRHTQEYQRILRVSVLSSIAIEGVKKAAERALSLAPDKHATCI